MMELFVQPTLMTNNLNNSQIFQYIFDDIFECEIMLPTAFCIMCLIVYMQFICEKKNMA